MRRAAAWIALAAAACGDGAAARDAAGDTYAPHPDAGPPRVDEADDCGGAAMTPGTGTPLAASELRIPFAPDNRLSFLADAAEVPIAAGLVTGAVALPFELFDRGPDPDACLKLALYRGACAGSCDFTDDLPDPVRIEAPTGDGASSRLRAMRSGPAGELALDGPGYLEVTFPFRLPLLFPTPDPFELIQGFAFPISVTQVSGALTPSGDGFAMLHVTGVLQPFRLGQLDAPASQSLGTAAGDSELDAVFANILGRSILFLQPAGNGCLLAEVDVDGDGLEAFCDSRTDGVFRVDTCIDGNGVALRDGDNGVDDCSQALRHGRPRFVDGITAQVVISAKPAAFTP